MNQQFLIICAGRHILLVGCSKQQLGSEITFPNQFCKSVHKLFITHILVGQNNNWKAFSEYTFNDVDCHGANSSDESLIVAQGKAELSKIFPLTNKPKAEIKNYYLTNITM